MRYFVLPEALVSIVEWILSCCQRNCTASCAIFQGAWLPAGHCTHHCILLSPSSLFIIVFIFFLGTVILYKYFLCLCCVSWFVQVTLVTWAALHVCAACQSNVPANCSSMYHKTIVCSKCVFLLCFFFLRVVFLVPASSPGIWWTEAVGLLDAKSLLIVHELPRVEGPELHLGAW